MGEPKSVAGLGHQHKTPFIIVLLLLLMYKARVFGVC